MRAIGLDVGAARIGVAATEAGLISSPHTTVRRNERAAATIAELVRRFDAAVIVVGLPLKMKGGGEGSQAALVRTFAGELSAQTTVPIEFYDERLTTVMAERSLMASGIRGGKLRAQVDAEAAAIILQGWLDHRRIAAARAAEA